MKKTILTAAMVLAANFAMADGFVCETEAGLIVKIYNQTSADMGTRSAATMILSDANIGHGNKTIAKFSAEDSLLTSHELTYIADVDLRFNNSNRKGELIEGTKLGELDQVIVSLDYSYSQPVAHGDDVAGILTLVKRNGEEIVSDLACTRYLKN